MAALQRPKYVYIRGALRAWEEATIHVGCEAATRGLNVFEGIKGYWQPDGRFAFAMLRQHYDRLRRSARLLHIPCDPTFEQFRDATFSLVDRLLDPAHDLWARPTLFVTEGHWGEGTKSDLVITAYNHPKAAPEPIALGISTWQRSLDNSFPARIKTTSNYQVGRLARIEGRSRGFHDMILLNQLGRVAEATGSCVLMVRGDTVATPPASEGSLESITLDLIEQLAGSMGIHFVRRPIDRTELLIADELAICGTLSELVLVSSIDGHPLTAGSPILGALQRRFFAAVRGEQPHPSLEMTTVPRSEGA